MTEVSWVELAQEGLRRWKRGDLGPALESLELCLTNLRSQGQTELWQVLVACCASQIYLQTGLYEQSTEALRRARDTWAENNFETRWAETAANLRWFEELLRFTGLDDEAELYRASLQENSSLFLGGDKGGGPFGPSARRQEASGVEESKFEMPTLFVQKVGHKIIPRLWGTHLRDAVANGQLGRRNEMANELLEARAIGVHERTQDRGMRLFWTSWVECLCCFLVAEYSQSDQSRHDCEELWLGLSVLPRLAEDPATVKVCEILEEFGYTSLAEHIRQELSQGRPPLLDPWRHLKVGFQTLGEVGEQTVEDQYREVVAACCEALSQGSFMDVESKIASLKARLERNKGEYPLATILVEHLFCVITQKRGNYSLASSLFSQCEKAWKAIPLHQKAEGPWVRIYRTQALENGLTYLSTNFPDKLYFAGGEKHGMTTMEVPVAGPTETTWAEFMQTAWASAREGHMDKALRAAVKADDYARQLSRRNLRLALTINVQSAIAHLMGNYGDAYTFNRESLTMWNQQVGQEDQEEAVTELIQALEASGWEQLAAALIAKRASGLPVLIDPEQDFGTVQMTRWKAEKEPVEEPVPTEARTIKKGWLAGLKSLFGRRQRLDE